MPDDITSAGCCLGGGVARAVLEFGATRSHSPVHCSHSGHPVLANDSENTRTQHPTHSQPNVIANGDRFVPSCTYTNTHAATPCACTCIYTPPGRHGGILEILIAQTRHTNGDKRRCCCYCCCCRCSARRRRRHHAPTFRCLVAAASAEAVGGVRLWVALGWDAAASQCSGVWLGGDGR